MVGFDEGSKMRNLRHNWKSLKNPQNNLKLKNQRMLPDMRAVSDTSLRMKNWGFYQAFAKTEQLKLYDLHYQ
jgi:hypothetical protein